MKTYAEQYLDKEPTEKTEFVVLIGREYFNKFFSPYKKGDKDPRYSENGELWYNILGYAETVGQAQKGLYGREFN